MPRGRGARAVVVVALVTAVAGCTAAPTPSPSPSPSATAEDQGPAPSAGDRIAIIVPPTSIVAGAEAAALLQAGRDLAVTPPADVLDVRVVAATTRAFVGDLAELAADDGYDVVCIVGVGSGPLALDLARARRDIRVCTTDAQIGGGPVNLVAVAVDPTVLVQAGAIAIGTAPAPVGLLLSPQLGDLELLTETFRSTVAEPVQPSPPPVPGPVDPGADATVDPTPSPPGPTSPQPPFAVSETAAGAAAQVAAGEQLAAERPSRALVLATPGGAAAAAAVGAGGTPLVSVSDWAVDEEGESPPNVLVGLTVDWSALLDAAIAAARSDDAAPVQLLGADVVGAVPGQAPGAVPAAERTVAFLGQATG